MNRFMRALRLLLVFTAFVIPFANAHLVSAHAHLKSSIPAAGSTVPAPDRVVAVFSNHDPGQVDGSMLEVLDASGKAVHTGSVQLDPSDTTNLTLMVMLQPNLPNGVYTVNWVFNDVVDTTGEGSFTFTVDSSAAPATIPAQPQAPVNASAVDQTPAVMPNTGDEQYQWYAALMATALFALALGWHIRRRIKV